MIIGGKGGAKTVTGLKFERKVNLLTKLAEVPGYTIKDNQVFYQGKLLAESYPKQKFYNKFLKDRGINYLDYISKRYEPDEALYVPEQNKFYIIEMKFQSGGGSVDEKLQTCDFKKKVYTKALSGLNIGVEYMYLLSDYFNADRYKDAFEYIESVGCSYHFDSLPLKALNFPEPISGSSSIDKSELVTAPADSAG